jgi:hypothetical protein
MDFSKKRKLLSGAVILATGLFITYLNGDIPPNLLNLMETLYGAFVLGNAFEHTSKAVIKKIDKKEETE